MREKGWKVIMVLNIPPFTHTHKSSNTLSLSRTAYHAHLNFNGYQVLLLWQPPPAGVQKKDITLPSSSPCSLCPTGTHSLSTPFAQPTNSRHHFTDLLSPTHCSSPLSHHRRRIPPLLPTPHLLLPNHPLLPYLLPHPHNTPTSPPPPPSHRTPNTTPPGPRPSHLLHENLHRPHRIPPFPFPADPIPCRSKLTNPLPNNNSHLLVNHHRTKQLPAQPDAGRSVLRAREGDEGGEAQHGGGVEGGDLPVLVGGGVGG